MYIYVYIYILEILKHGFGGIFWCPQQQHRWHAASEKSSRVTASFLRPSNLKDKSQGLLEESMWPRGSVASTFLVFSVMYC